MKMDAERWSGITRTMAANSDWLATLDARLHLQGVNGARLTDEIAGRWQSYRPVENLKNQQARWVTGDTQGKLWRARHSGGWQLYVWTGGEFAGETSVVRLTGDDATRTMFALDNAASVPLTLEVDTTQSMPEIVFEGRFPLAEYRYLTTLGEFLGYRKGKARYRFSNDTIPKAVCLLADRLGLLIAKSEELQ